MSERDTMLICDPTTSPTCPCTDDEPYDCQCDASADGAPCTACGATMVRIDTDTGARVAA